MPPLSEPRRHKSIVRAVAGDSAAIETGLAGGVWRERA